MEDNMGRLRSRSATDFPAGDRHITIDSGRLTMNGKLPKATPRMIIG